MEALDFAGLDTWTPDPEEVPPPADPWLARRGLAWGASEMAMVMVATGRAEAAQLPRWAQDRVRVTNRTRGVPRIIAEKAGIVRPRKAGRAAELGTEREVELLRAWQGEIARGAYALEEEARLEAESVTHASAVPREWMPLQVRGGVMIAATPDGWARDVAGSLYDVELKCTGAVNDLAWSWRVQVQAQGLATGSAGAFVVAGEWWAVEARERGRVLRAFVEPDLEMRREMVQAAREAWSMVEALRASL